MDYSPPDSSAHGILQASILERVTMPFSSPGDLPDSRIELPSPASPALAGGFFTTKPPVQFSLLVVSDSL